VLNVLPTSYFTRTNAYHCPRLPLRHLLLALTSSPRCRPVSPSSSVLCSRFGRSRLSSDVHLPHPLLLLSATEAALAEYYTDNTIPWTANPGIIVASIIVSFLGSYVSLLSVSFPVTMPCPRTLRTNMPRYLLFFGFPSLHDTQWRSQLLATPSPRSLSWCQ
jgi:hypothetical protein